mmetsp:Transcript_17147/g.24815  ORF Transcript_17147/g.24815 Transcript_17147/m.24815 type:complete len:155 (+) Transcript_17147:2-466(+)
MNCVIFSIMLIVTTLFKATRPLCTSRYLKLKSISLLYSSPIFTPPPAFHNDELIKEKKKITLTESELDEKFVRGSGNGGQKINTTANRVQLTHLPTKISVSCQDARDLSTNRKIARKLLIDKLDMFYNGSESKLGIAQEKIRKKKKNAKRCKVM